MSNEHARSPRGPPKTGGGAARATSPRAAVVVPDVVVALAPRPLRTTPMFALRRAASRLAASRRGDAQRFALRAFANQCPHDPSKPYHKSPLPLEAAGGLLEYSVVYTDRAMNHMSKPFCKVRDGANARARSKTPDARDPGARAEPRRSRGEKISLPRVPRIVARPPPRLPRGREGPAETRGGTGSARRVARASAPLARAVPVAARGGAPDPRGAPFPPAPVPRARSNPPARAHPRASPVSTPSETLLSARDREPTGAPRSSAVRPRVPDPRVRNRRSDGIFS